MQAYLFALVIAIFWLQNRYWNTLIISILLTYAACKWMVRHIPMQIPTDLDTIKTWLKFIVSSFLPVALLVTWCILLSPFHLIWSPVELFAHYNITSRMPLAPTQIMYDPATSHSSATQSGLIEVDIFAIHGLGSDPETTWKHRESGRVWLCEFLPVDFPTFRIIALNHDSRWDANAPVQTLTDYGSGLLDAVEGTRSSREEQRRPIIFIGHSFGGILAKKALVLANEADPESSRRLIAESTIGALFLGTPHEGTPIADLAAVYCFFSFWRGSRAQLLEFMSPDTDDIQSLHSSFLNRYFDWIYICNFFENRREMLWNVPLWKTVERHTAQMRPRPLVALDAHHRGLNKYASMLDPNYIKVRQQIKKAYEEYKRKKNRNTISERDLPILGNIPKFIEPVPQECVSVPFQTVPMYTARKELSSLIEKKLRVRFENSSVPHALVVHGLGGAGKTQLTLKFVEEHKDEFNPILWIDAHSPETVRSSFERCATKLRLPIDRNAAPSSNLEEAPAVQAVLRWLVTRNDSDEEWLVVIDNADDTTWDVEGIIPRGKRGSVIITSQHPQSPLLLRKQCERLHVGVMEPWEAKRLLLKHLDWDNDSVADEIGAVASEIVTRLECLALAVDLVGFYLGEQTEPEVALRRYLVDFDRHQDDLLRRESFYKLSMYEKTIWTVWDTTLDTIETRFPTRNARLLLTFLAQFDRANVQDELFRLASRGFPKVEDILCSQEQKLPEWLMKFIALSCGEWDSFYFREALEPLLRYSLVQRVSGEWPGVTMHGLVQWRAKKYTDDQRWKFWSSVFLTAAAYETTEESGRPQFRRYVTAHLLGHDISVGSQWRNVAQTEKGAAFVWKTIGSVYFDEGRWEEAEGLQVQAMEMWKKILGRDHPDTMASMMILAMTYQSQGRWKEAEELQVHVVETRKKELGEEHPDTQSSIGFLAFTYRNQIRWKEAEELQAQVVKTRKRVLGEEHPDTLNSMTHLVSTYEGQGRLKEAEELQVQVVETSKKVLGEEHPNTLSSINNLASLYTYRGQWKKAEELQVQVMETRKRIQGGEHPDTLNSMDSLAISYGNQDRWEEAEKLRVQVMETKKKVLGEKHPDTLTSMDDLAWIYRGQGRWKEAEELQVQVVGTRKKVLGEEHPDTLTSIHNLATTYILQGRWEEAEELLVHVIEARIRVLGEGHHDTLKSINNLAAMRLDQGRWKEAEQLRVQVMETRKKVLGEEHSETLTSMDYLAQAYQKQGRQKEAEELQVKVVEIRKKVYGGEDPDTLKSINNLVMIYMHQGRWKAAENLQAQVVKTMKRVLGIEHLETLTIMDNLASIYMRQGQWKEAEGLQVQQMQARKKMMGEEHPDTLTYIDHLAAIYMYRGLLKEAEELQIQVMEIRKKVLGKEHPDTQITMEFLAWIYQNQGRWKQAEKLQVEVMELRKRVLGEDHPETLKSINSLAVMYKVQGRLKDAEELQMRYSSLAVIETPEHSTTARPNHQD